MKKQFWILAPCSLLLLAPISLLAEKAPEPPVPVMSAPAPQDRPARGPENQRLYGPSSATIVPAEQAQALVAKFREAYVKMGSPRILFYINRDLVDTQSGLKLNGRTEKNQETKSQSSSSFESTGTAAAATAAPQTQININANGSTSSATPHHPAAPGKTESQSSTLTSSGENSYVMKDGTKVTLADRQTSREIERLFGRAFRAAGASLADQKTATDLLGDKPLANLAGTNDQASKDREALSKIADVAIEILVTSRVVTIPAVSGDQQVTVPDIQVTAIRMKDAAIVGQASSSDILGKDRNAGIIAQQFDVRDITEATALALMEDMLSSIK
jgi:hypothetical protein